MIFVLVQLYALDSRFTILKFRVCMTSFSMRITLKIQDFWIWKSFNFTTWNITFHTPVEVVPGVHSVSSLKVVKTIDWWLPILVGYTLPHPWSIQVSTYLWQLFFIEFSGYLYQLICVHDPCIFLLYPLACIIHLFPFVDFTPYKC